MTATVIDGKQMAEEIRGEVAEETRSLRERLGVTPGLAAVLVGSDPASAVYVRNKRRACDEADMFSETFELPEETSQEELIALVRELNADPRFHGILVQLPLPPHIEEREVILAIDPDKDVDGMHPINGGRLLEGNPRFLPATPAGVQQMLVRSGNDPAGKHVVIVGRSNIVGKPLATLLMQKAPGANATVTVCHTGTRDLPALTRQADIVVAAIGRPRALTAEMVADGAVVVDVGINRVDDATRKSGYRLVGDVDYDAVAEKASAITPVPGGVGPMTIAMLLTNTLRAARYSVGDTA
ncbi:MAG: bifunctional methylenetetrahydrofolate dehydrogenase/methenyltetrahydrofolate cyclohydrolase FolD [Chloroflexota bacterium]|nr:bifunctional methylenetetrahydrofolate dehydrogenase/methenyltetrahydrofolate cyclohydrolase FolD [Chloroflexota bacterium]MDE2884901.1 bifunctional methylenetetrahydrofolate dehydrogenase/methenyltetrahydrofolate cyclohydrolase FolD [Chloroflexota bacterium]